MTLLAGGVGGARMARALRSVVDPGLLTIVVNVGDDTERYGVHVSPDPDTVLYTLAGIEGPHGWGRADDTFAVMDELREFGVDTSFRLGDADLAMCIARTRHLAAGRSLSSFLEASSKRFGVDGVAVLPATDDPVRTWVETNAGEWLSFQEYFVDRQHADPVRTVTYRGVNDAEPSPGVLEAITAAGTLVIAPSNPPLSIWPILRVPGIGAAVRAHPRTIAVSPLFGGVPLKGPADTVMRGLGLSDGTAGVLEAYDGWIDALVIDVGDADDARLAESAGIDIIVTDTRITDSTNGADLVGAVLEWSRR